ncbi:putative Zinc finger, DPH-type [Rosa chinensis]|uniref:Diphthamide biosynthesis protein 3 n=1 Tax=Rosa chinensis TaxID=74649 RepID=A0A2P6PN14_ROSCH|nr:putative Zinc finger, DPH-type [Rosa chinensis]
MASKKPFVIDQADEITEKAAFTWQTNMSGTTSSRHTHTHNPCPCGDLFQITKEDLKLGEEIARCPSCTLYITVVYNIEDFMDKKPTKPFEPSKQQSLTVA